MAIANGVGAPNIEKSIEGINGTYREIKSKLQSTFTKTLDGLGEQEAEIIGSYGLQSSLGQMIETDVWGTESAAQRAASIAQAQRNYEVSVWKTILPGIWSAFSIQPEVSGELCEERGKGEHGPSACEWTGPNGNQWRLDVIESNGECGNIFTAPCNAPPKELRNALFAPTQEGCTAAAGGSKTPVWESNRCNLGVAPEEVFERWGLPTYECVPHGVEARCHSVSAARPRSASARSGG
jgi:hypothetical protein